MSFLRLLALGLVALGLTASQRPASQPSSPSTSQPVQEQVESTLLEPLLWLVGTWRMVNGDVTTDEIWLPLKGDTLFGVSQTYDSEKTRFFEFLRIATTRGKVAYVAMPGGAPPTAFTMTSVSESEVVFEAPEHDHPQRIRYEKTAEGLTATISMLDGTRAMSFVMKRL